MDPAQALQAIVSLFQQLLCLRCAAHRVLWQVVPQGQDDFGAGECFGPHPMEGFVGGFHSDLAFIISEFLEPGQLQGPALHICCVTGRAPSQGFAIQDVEEGVRAQSGE